MSLLSKQELDVAVKVLEDKIEFILKAFAVNNPLDPFGQPKTLLQVYYEVKGAGLTLDQSVNGFSQEIGEAIKENDVTEPIEPAESLIAQ